ncbi:glucosamine-6-phosphate deaminase [soil metagenome]|jgi:glucosamine-6-phosphate deaminase
MERRTGTVGDADITRSEIDLIVLAAPRWAAHVASEVVARLRSEPQLRLCLPTGDTPAPLYAALADALGDPVTAQGATIGGATIVLLDEYVGLAADDPARCDNQLRHDLIERLAQQPAAVQHIRVDELAPPEAAAAHDEVAARGIDLAIVGLGLNGHVGFNEPGSTADSPTRVVTLAAESIAVSQAEYGAASVPRMGVTLGLARLLEAGEIWLLVTGAHKSDILRHALREPESADVPASFLRRHPRLTVFADEAAAADLRGAG